MIQEYVNINGHEHYTLQYPHASSKAVLLMLHGGPGHPNSFIGYYLKDYLDFANVVYYDQRGTGKTQIRNKSTADEISQKVMIEDLREMIAWVKKRYQTTHVFLIGHSWGSMLGTQYILKYPQDVSGFIGYGVMVDTPSQERHWYKWLKEHARGRDVKKMEKVPADFPNTKDYEKGYDILEWLEMKYGFAAADFMKIYRKSPIMTLKSGMMMGVGPKIHKKWLLEVAPTYSILDTTQYECPVYYVLGRNDQWTTSTIAADYFETIQAPKKGLYWIEDTGHMVDTDNPEAFSDTIRKIIEEVI